MYSRDLFDSEFYLEFHKWRDAYPDDTHMAVLPKPDGSFHISQTGTIAEIDYIVNHYNAKELKAGRRNSYRMMRISDVPDESAPLGI